MDDQRSLLQPLIPTIVANTATHSSGSAITATVATAASPSSCHHNSVSINGEDFFCTNKSVILRLLLVFSAMVISLWANYEASKTFEITLINDTKDSPAGRRFDLFYVSNDRASRLILNATSFVEQFLYPDPQEYPKKHVCHVTLRLARRNLASGDGDAVSFDGEKVNGYVVDLSPSLLEEANHGEEAIASAVLRAVARVWLWDGESKAPARLIDGVVEFVAEEAGFRREIVAGDGEISPENEDWWENKNPKVVARFLRYGEGYKEGFIRRLNRAMRDTWTDGMVDDALGMSAKKLSGFYNASWASWPGNNNNIHVI